MTSKKKTAKLIKSPREVLTVRYFKTQEGRVILEGADQRSWKALRRWLDVSMKRGWYYWSPLAQYYVIRQECEIDVLKSLINAGITPVDWPELEGIADDL